MKALAHWCISVAILVQGCAEPAPAPPPPEVPTAIQAIGRVATIVMQDGPRTVEIGASISLAATALDAAGQVVSDAPVFWTSSSSMSLASSGDGTFEGLAVSSVEVVAYTGTVQSAPVDVVVVDPKMAETDTLELRVVFPDGAADRVVTIHGPGGSKPAQSLGPGQARIEKLRYRNQLASVKDADTGELLLFKICRGDHALLGEQPPETDLVDARSTAEALVYLTPGIAHTSPVSLEGFRRLTADLPEMAALEAAIAQRILDVGTWSPEELLPQRREAAAATLLKLGGALQARQGKADSVFPKKRGGIEAALIGCDKIGAAHGLWAACKAVEWSPLFGALTLTNYHPRHVHAFLDPGPGKPPLPLGMKPIPISSVTLINGFWQFFLWDVPTLLGNNQNPFVDGYVATQTVQRLIPIDPTIPGGSSVWHLTTYTLGLNRTSLPFGLIPIDLIGGRAVPPILRTLLFDVALQIVGIVTTTADMLKGPEVEAFKELVDGPVCRAEVLAIFNESYSHASGDDQTADLLFSVVPKILDLAEKTIKTLDPDVFAKLGMKSAGQLVEALLVIPAVWDVTTGIIQLMGTVYVWLTENYAEHFLVTSAAEGSVTPLNRWLPEQELGCAFEQKFEVFGESVPATWGNQLLWTFDLPNGGEGWTVDIFGYVNGKAPSPDSTFGLWATVKKDAITDADIAPGESHVEIGVTLQAYVGGQAVDYDTILDKPTFYIPVRGEAVTVQAVRLEGQSGEGVEPGETVLAVIEAETCLVGDAAAIEGRVFSELFPTGKVTFEASLEGTPSGSVTLKAQIPDGTYKLTGQAGHVAKTMSFGYGTATVLNVPPTAQAQSAAVSPGESFIPTILVSDANFAGLNFSEVPASSVAAQPAPAGLTVIPAPDAVPFVWKADLVKSATGTQGFVAAQPLTLAVPHADNDGTDGTGGTPHVIVLHASDDDLESATAELQVTVKNVAPAIGSAPADLAVVSGEPSTAFQVTVTDDNGVADVGALIVSPVDYGFTVTERKDGEGVVTFTVSADPVSLPESGCGDGCTLTLVALDTDDVLANGGESAAVTVALLVGVATCVPGSDTCGDSAYCAFNGGVCGAESGVCKPIPESCAPVVPGASPICGCDDQLYPSGCEAERLSVTSSTTGGCEVVSSCIAPSDCGPGQTCQLSAGSCGAPGVCVVAVGACDAAGGPACGCDGTTWPSACDAAAAGIAVYSAGACGSTCNDTTLCPGGQVCLRPAGSCGLSNGVCVSPPRLRWGAAEPRLRLQRNRARVRVCCTCGRQNRLAKRRVPVV